METTKSCKKCLIEKELEMFDKITEKSHRGTCRKCRNEKNYSSWISKEGNYEKRKEYNRNYMREIYQTNPVYKIYNRVLATMSYKLKKNIDFRSLFESKFKDGMTWDNYGLVWEIDHIKSAIKMIREGYTIEEINHIDNVRPLGIKENRERKKK